LMDDDGIELWSVYRGVRIWARPFDESSPPVSGGSPSTAVRGEAKAVGFLSGDRHVLSAAVGRHISIHDRKTGEIIIKRSFRPEVDPSTPNSTSRITEINERGIDEGLKVVWDAGFGPSLWNLRNLSRRCTFAVDQPPNAHLMQVRNRFAILSPIKRAFA